jgi:cysteinyl-tRNA synthetase
MKLYNTASKLIEEFHPLEDKSVKLYACGPTVYDYTHLGHLRKYVLDDILVRTLRHAGYEVKHVQNITDVGHLTSDDDVGEDKLEKGAKKYHTGAEALARRFEDYFFYSMDLLGVLRPSLSCRATDHIQAQLEMVLALEKKGLTYVIEGDGVYFDTSKIDDYGKLINPDPKLAKQVLMAQREGERVDKVIGRKHPTDFALWKFERPGENRQMVWPSPWHERSFPGWHIECSAMALEHLGEQIDIHTGGVDHINIHHTNEIAQTEAVTGKKPFSRYWVHHNYLFIDGQKMSKSLNNFYTIDDVIERGFAPRALRLLFLMSHYRSEQNFTWDSLAAAQKAYLKLARFVLDLRNSKRNSELELSDFPGAVQLHHDFFDAIENDLKTNEALTVLWELMQSDLDSDVLYRLVMEFDQVLGLGLAGLTEESLLEAVKKALAKTIIDQDFAQKMGVQENLLQLSDLPDSIQELIKKRQLARRDQDFTEADRLRAELKEQGYELLDLADGQLAIRKIK